MVVAVAIGVACVLVLAAALAIVRYGRRPTLEPLDPGTIGVAPEPVAPQIRILRSPEEINDAIQRATTTEAAIAEMASKRAARYSRFGGPRSVPDRAKDERPRVTRLRIGDEPGPPTGTAEPGM